MTILPRDLSHSSLLRERLEVFIRYRQQMIGELCVLLTSGELALVGARNFVQNDSKLMCGCSTQLRKIGHPGCRLAQVAHRFRRQPTKLPHRINNLRKPAIINAIVDKLGVLAGLHKARVAKDRQLLRKRWLANCGFLCIG